MVSPVEDIQQQKNAIRQYIRNLKSTISATEKVKQASLAFQKLEQLPEFQHAKVIFIYWSFPYEL